MKKRLGKTLAAFCIANWLLGIGDRHPENFLLDIKSGSLIGIDFGAAFGAGVHLPVPELVPFRLTRQVAQVYHPLDSLSLLKQDMITSLDALRDKKDVLLEIMDVFAKEPMLDWISNARNILYNAKHAPDAIKQSHNELAAQLQLSTRDKDLSKSDDIAFYPKEKISIAKSKLQLVHPSLITATELSTSQSLVRRTQLLQRCIRAVKGIPPSSRSQSSSATTEMIHDYSKRTECNAQDGALRARNGWKMCSSSREQVDFLVDQATDPLLLGRMFWGWSAAV
jgi:DNA-dependent protein kinase catalytic subunit